MRKFYRTKDMILKGEPPNNAQLQETRLPPPAYTELSSETPSSSTALSSPSAAIGAQQSPLLPNQPVHNYGPTPIGRYYPNSIQRPVDGSAINNGGVTVGYLPYYDPSSPHAIEEARRRGRRRFFGALLWVLVIWLILGMIGGGITKDLKKKRKHWG